MCGLVCLVSPNIDINKNLLNIMRDRLTHRGPDHGGSWLSESKKIGLAHRRLSVIDLIPESNQPMSSICKQYEIVYNGEIYNYKYIRKELESRGHRFSTSSDTEVILEAYKEWGEECLDYFNGMFAFVILDKKLKVLFIARDRFGEKPLFVGRGKNNVIVFASEMKAILAHPLISDSINYSSVNSFVEGTWYEEGEETFFSNIKRFPARHFAIYSLNGEELKKTLYWEPSISNSYLDASTREIVDQFKGIFEESINLRSLADVPVGSSLSGGLDSSAIVNFIQKSRSDKTSFSTFSAIFNDDPTISEHEQIKLVSSSLETSSNYVSPTSEGLQNESLLLHWHQEEPFLSASIYLQWCVARLAKENNVTVLLDGQGADELLGGYQFLFKRHQIDLLHLSNLGKTLRISKKFRDRLIFESKNYSDSERRFSTFNCYTEEELLSMASNPPNIPSNFYMPTSFEGLDKNYKRSLYEGLFYNSLPMLLRYADRNSMAFSREVRLPFLDHRLVEFGLSIPDSILVRNGWQKYILRQSLSSSVPPTIKWRRDKVGYAAPLDLWLRGTLKKWAYERVTDNSLSIADSFDLQSNWSNFMDHQFKPGTNLSWPLWKWISLSEWLSLHRSGVWKCGIDSSLLSSY